MAGNPLTKLERAADIVAKEMSEALKRGQADIRQLIRDAGKNIAPGTSQRRREQMVKAITAHYAAISKGIDASLQKLAHKTAKAATDDVRKHGLNVKFSEKRLRDIWAYISPSNERNLAAVFTDRMSDTAIAALRKAFLDTYRQAQVEGWTANETNKHMQAAWNDVADDDNNFRFVDKAGKKWENARYLQMLHRTTMSRVERDYTIDRMASVGITLFKISDDGSAECDGCRAWEGQIIQMYPSKEHQNIPTYDEAIAAGCFHPNCLHYLIPMDPDWGDDAEEIARQDSVPRLPEDADEADVQARKDAIDLRRYREKGMTVADAELAMTRERLADAIRIGSFDREASLAVVASLTDGEIAAVRENGIPKFVPTKDKRNATFNAGSAGGVVHFDRSNPEGSIRDVLYSAESIGHDARAAEYMKTVPNDQLDAVKLYSHKENGVYGRINSTLRKGLDLSEDDQRVRELIEKTLDGAPKHVGNTVRGVAGPPDMSYIKMLTSLQVGKSFPEYGFCSSSLSGAKAHEYADDNAKPGYVKVIIHAVSKTGASIQGVSDHEDDKEVLFKPGTRFKLVNRQQIGDCLHLFTEEV